MDKTQKKSKLIVAALLTTVFSVSASAMGKRPSGSSNSNSGSSGSSGGTKPPSPSVPVIREPAAISDSITPEGFDPFVEVAAPIGRSVDGYYKSYRELLPTRSSQNSHYTDSCDTSVESKDAFSDRIAWAIELKMQPSKAQLSYVSSYFGLSSDANSYLPNSLISHPLCKVTSSTLNTTLGGKNIPSAATITKINKFADLMNGYRREALAGNSDGYKKASKL